MDTLEPTPDIQVVFNPDHVVSQICFENAHDIAQLLSLEQPEVALALFNELLFWKESGRF